MENARIECVAKPITHGFIHFKNDEERNKFVRSANMLKKRVTRKEVENITINGHRSKISSQKKGVCQILHSWEAQHSIRFDNHELDSEADCGKDMPKWKPNIHQKPRHWSRSGRTNGKIAIKKLIATPVSSREFGLKRREEGKTMSSQRQTATQGNQQKHQRRRRQRQAQKCWRRLPSMHETQKESIEDNAKNKKKARKEEE